MSSPSKPTLISLFAGAGGLDLGLEIAGFETVVINELEAHACQTLELNRELSQLEASQFDPWLSERLEQRCYRRATNDQKQVLRRRLKPAVGSEKYLGEATILQGDLRTLDTSDLLAAGGLKPGEPSLVAGGPPCQPFSRAGKRQTVSTSDGQLFVEFARVVDETRPRWFLFENVKGLAQSKTTIWFSRCATCHSISLPPFDDRRVEPEEGSSAGKCLKCRSEAFWVIDKNKRGGSLDLICSEFERIGYATEWRILNAADFGLSQVRERLFIVGSRDGEPFSWPRETHGRESNTPQQSLLAENGPRDRWATMWDRLWRDGHWRYGELDRDGARLWVKNVVRPHDEPVTWSLDRPSPTIGAHQAAKLALAPGGVPDEQLARQQWHTKGRRQRDLPPVPVEHEYLTDEELLVLQGFPRSWYLDGTRMQRAFQIGNAVPPPLAAAVGGQILAADAAQPEAPLAVAQL